MVLAFKGQGNGEVPQGILRWRGQRDPRGPGECRLLEAEGRRRKKWSMSPKSIVASADTWKGVSWQGRHWRSGGGGSQTGVGGGVNGDAEMGFSESLFQKTGLHGRSQALHGARKRGVEGVFIFKMRNCI